MIFEGLHKLEDRIHDLELELDMSNAERARLESMAFYLLKGYIKRHKKAGHGGTIKNCADPLCAFSKRVMEYHHPSEPDYPPETHRGGSFDDLIQSLDLSDL